MNAAKKKGAQQSDAMKAKVEALGLASLWYTDCPKCKAKLRGTFQELRMHACGKTS